MVARMSLAMLLVSLMGCGKPGEKDPRMEKILKDHEASKTSDGDSIDFDKLPGSTSSDPSKDTSTAGGNSSDSTSGSSNPSSTTPGTTPSSGLNSLGSIVNIGFYCSKTSSNQIGTNVQKATGVSVKLFSVAGMIVAEDGDIGRAQSRRTGILNSKSADVTFTNSIADGLYYIAYCDAAQHAGCNISPDRRADPISSSNSKNATGVVGYADNVSVSNGKIIAVGKTEALLPYPQTNDEKAICDKTVSFTGQ